jgi:ABC-type multidrug transport system fused ATPase/permease subunit
MTDDRLKIISEKVCKKLIITTREKEWNTIEVIASLVLMTKMKRRLALIVFILVWNFGLWSKRAFSNWSIPHVQQPYLQLNDILFYMFYEFWNILIPSSHNHWIASNTWAIFSRNSLAHLYSKLLQSIGNISATSVPSETYQYRDYQFNQSMW